MAFDMRLLEKAIFFHRKFKTIPKRPRQASMKKSIF